MSFHRAVFDHHPRVSSFVKQRCEFVVSCHLDRGVAVVETFSRVVFLLHCGPVASVLMTSGSFWAGPLSPSVLTTWR